MQHIEPNQGHIGHQMRLKMGHMDEQNRDLDEQIRDHHMLAELKPDLHFHELLFHFNLKPLDPGELKMLHHQKKAQCFNN